RFTSPDPMNLAGGDPNLYRYAANAPVSLVDPSGFKCRYKFSLAGPEKFNAVIGFFAGMPKHVLLGMEVVLIWLPLLFHGVYGLFITGRAQNNAFGTTYGWTENKLYTLQRVTGIVVFLFLIYHVLTTTVNAKLNGEQVILYSAWRDKLSGTGYLLLFVYMIGVAACSFHLCHGTWNFCIRWGLTIGDASQRAVHRFSMVLFVLVTLLGWLALFGFLTGGGAEGPVQALRSGPFLASTA
ncbi:MAG: hypothetical protein HY248_03335, partial [Fimbriimonas ginsengisoli]|nr:hypothetical protein [Fimbriimonas ginsengisoli]